MTRIMVRKAISIFFVVQGVIVTTFIFSFATFINIEVAFISSLLIIIGSSFAFSKMIQSQVDSGQYEEKRDILDEIEDRHDLYSEENRVPLEEELDLKQIVKEEKAKIKTFSLSSIKHGARGSLSLLRLVPYIFLVLGFIALKNNEILDLTLYLPSLFVGIIVGSILSKELAK